ncbi:MAG: phosphonate ABC transporter, permease protein PhnE [candidate division NC10 bacterium]|nr:phosphonate ABC transporter, permease protein PhnE [Candidatus Rokubacteria bacterium]MBI4390740.1 phosphonate ABC transporter, permease protein PhnE [candidate division NC10 bacterium]
MRAEARRPTWPWLASAGFALLIVWSYQGTRVDLAGLLGGEGRHQIMTYAVKLFPPDLSAATLRDAAVGAVETFAISFVGSVLAVLIALPLSVLTTRSLLYRGILYEGRRLGPVSKGIRIGIYMTAKAILNVLRTIPEIAWALIFVLVVGLGPFPGVLALGFHTGGVLGKLFGEVLEDVNPRLLETLHGAGAGRLAILFYGILPQAAPQCLSYALYRWEVNIRAAAIMGFVGAGGLGQRIHIAISLFLEHQLLTLILAIYVMVTVVDVLSAYLRRRLL